MCRVLFFLNFTVSRIYCTSKIAPFSFQFPLDILGVLVLVACLTKKFRPSKVSNTAWNISDEKTRKASTKNLFSQIAKRIQRPSRSKRHENKLKQDFWIFETVWIFLVSLYWFEMHRHRTCLQAILPQSANECPTLRNEKIAVGVAGQSRRWYVEEAKNSTICFWK